MALELLCQILPPPETPQDNGRPEEWARIEHDIGTTLPDDYKAYIQTFGTGCIGRYLWVFNPFSTNEHLHLLKQIQAQLNALRVLKDTFGEECPYPLYPEAGGLLPWGITDNGDVLFWQTLGAPEAWTVVVGAAREPRYKDCPEGLTSFLYNLIMGHIDSQIIPYDFIDKAALFTPGIRSN